MTPQAPSPSAPPSPAQHPAAFLWRALRGPLLPASALLCLLAAGAQALETLAAVALRSLVNSISTYAPGAASSTLVGAAASFVACAAGAAALSAVFLRIDIGARKRLLSGVERTLFSHVLGHAPRYFEDRLPGEIAQQIRNAGEAASGLFSAFTHYGMRFLAMAVSTALVFSASIPALNLVTLVWAVAFLGGSYHITRTCAELSREVARRSGAVVGRMVDSVRNIAAVRSSAAQGLEDAYVGSHIDAERRAQADLRIQFYRLVVFQLSCQAVLNVVVVGWSLHALFQGRIDVGSVVMLITLAALVSALVREISSRMYELFDNYGTLSQALRRLTIEHAIRDAPGAVALSPGEPSIRFEGVSFRYPSGSFAMEALDLRIAPGEKVGIVGPSGGGKSTLLRLLKREYEPQAGRVLVSGTDVAQCTLASLANAIAEVPQQVRLFNRTIHENIAYGRPDATEADIRGAAQVADCLELIERRATGIDAEVGDDGSRLSGGERRRIAIARASLKAAPILLLDEATSGLDAASEARVQHALERLMEGRTVIAIAHRPETLAKMDRIVVIAAGRIVDLGEADWRSGRDSNPRPPA